MQGSASVPRVKIEYADLPVAQFDGSWNWVGGAVEWFSLWNTQYAATAYGGVNSTWSAENRGHPVVEDKV